MAREFSPEFWLGISKKQNSCCSFADPMELAFKDKFGVDTFTFVRELYSFNGCQWEVGNAYAYLQKQIDALFEEMRSEYIGWKKVDYDPFSQLTAERSPQLAVPTSAVG